MKIMKYIIPILLSIISLFFYSCADVKAYQKIYVNDNDMQSDSPIDEFDDFMNYREGGSGGGNSGNTGGGCGCN